MKYTLIQEGHFEYIEEGNGPPLVLLHGLFGALSNWADVLTTFSQDYKVIIPLMPIYRASFVDPSVDGLADFISDFVEFKKLDNINLVGNSLGGHVGLIYTLTHPEKVKTLTLTGSSGLFESGMGSTFPRRGDINYVRDRVGFTFYDPHTATPALVDEVFDIVNDTSKAIRVVKVARAAQRMNLRHELPKIKQPACLIWGLNDNITPVFTAHEFHSLIPQSELHFIDHCGHAPMMEKPVLFNNTLSLFLKKHQLPLN